MCSSQITQNKPREPSFEDAGISDLLEEARCDKMLVVHALDLVETTMPNALATARYKVSGTA